MNTNERFIEISERLSQTQHPSNKSSKLYSLAEHACHCVFSALSRGMNQDSCLAVFSFASGYGLPDAEALEIEKTVLESEKSFWSSEESQVIFNSYARFLGLVDRDLIFIRR